VTTRCPSCFEHLPEDAYQWMCTSGKCETVPDPAASAYTGTNVVSGPITQQLRPREGGDRWQPVHPGSCSNCGGERQEICVRCHHVLPAGWREGQATCIAMNGARATGKSLFIAVLIKQLDQLLAKHNSTVEYGDQHTRAAYTDIYEQPLYEARGLMAPTPRGDTDNSYQKEPLVFSLGFLNGVRRFLVIRDVAGEDMETPPDDARRLKFLAHADAIFFMFDPLAVPEVRAKLQDLVPGQLQSGGNPHAVLTNLLALAGRQTPRLAVILSKFDAMHELRHVDDIDWQTIMSNTGAAFLRDPSLETAAYDEDDAGLLHQEVRSLLHRLGADKLVLTLENPHGGQNLSYRFFVASALGESPHGAVLHPRGIAPFRCLDPVKWVLNATGAI
jgi:hypothetical protein